jgi:hypothetical protein
MSRRPRTAAADPHRKANFREEARGIVAKDRYDRKYGHAVDTAGAIARALERAYKQGFADAQDDHVRPTREVSDGGPLEWVLIPPRPRNAFWSCCLFMFGRHGDQPRGGYLAQLYQLTEKSERNQRRSSESLHYTGWVAARAGFAARAVMRGGGWDGRSSLSWFTRSFCSAFSSV